MKLEGKRIVLIGAASGIGRALLERLSTFTAKIVAADIQHEQLDHALAELGAPAAQVTPWLGDLSKPEEVDRLLAESITAMGGVDLYFANAGFAHYGGIAAPDWGALESVFRLNVFSSIYAAEKMKELAGENPYRVVVTASAMSFWSVPGYAIYSATKAALHRFADGYRFELDDPAKLTLVYPIATKTGFFDTSSGPTIPIPWPQQLPEDVAAAIIRGVERDKRSIHPSRLFAFLLFVERFFPWIKSIVQRRSQRALEEWSKSNR